MASSPAKERSSAAEDLHFWACSSAFFETVFLFNPLVEAVDQVHQGSVTSQAFRIRIFDPDGFKVNEVQTQFAADQIGVLEFEPLLAGCKLESGFKHAHVVVSSDRALCVTARLQSQDGACIMAPPCTVTANLRTFFPVGLMKDAANLLCLINRGEKEASVRARFYCGERSPEALWNVPSYGARIFNITEEFRDYFDLAQGGITQAYLRLSVRGDYELGAQLIERIAKSGEAAVLTTLS